MASAVYNTFKAKIMNGSIDLDTDTIKLALLTSSYTPNIDGTLFWSDVSSFEVPSSGTYVASTTNGGVTLTCTVSQDDTDNEGVFDANDVSFTSATITARYAVIYKSTGTAATSPLICYIDFGSNQTSTNGTFAITFASEGILNLN